MQWRLWSSGRRGASYGGGADKEVFPYFFQNEDFNLADEKFLGIDMVLRDGIIRWRFTPENVEYYVSIRDLGALKGFTEIIKIPDKEPLGVMEKFKCPSAMLSIAQ